MGGGEFDTWLRCMAAASFKETEAYITVKAEEVTDTALSFFVDRRLLKSNDSLTEAASDNQVRVMLIERKNGTAVVEVPGEPISFGPKVVVPSGDLE